MTNHFPDAPERTMVALEAAIFLGIGIGSAAVGGLLLVSMLVYLLHWASSERLPVPLVHGFRRSTLGLLGERCS